jgi:hypothetical protein
MLLSPDKIKVNKNRPSILSGFAAYVPKSGQAETLPSSGKRPEKPLRPRRQPPYPAMAPQSQHKIVI